jgi:hypothetical protein
MVEKVDYRRTFPARGKDLLADRPGSEQARGHGVSAKKEGKSQGGVMSTTMTW